MSARLQMTTRARFGVSNRAKLNLALLEALQASTSACETCRTISKDVDSQPDGGEYVETAGFPGTSIPKLDAHFKSHWKGEYELVDTSGRREFSG
jgi:hypothetical protein